MRTLPALLLALLLSPHAIAVTDTVQAWLAPAASEVETIDLTWKDPKRGDREIPALIYYPKSGKGPYPLVLFSHGLGGSRFAAEYLGRYLAGHGYIAVHLEHRGSDTKSVLGAGPIRESAFASAANVENAVNRATDVSFAIDEMQKSNSDDPKLKDRIDLKHIGLAGHSFGANTTMLCIGQKLPAIVTGGQSLVDPRIKAALPLSAPVPLRSRKLEEVYSDVKVPVMHMTGTEDNSPIGDTTAEQRRIPYDNTHAKDQYLITFKGGDHMIFSGRRLNAAREKQDDQFHSLINAAATAFFDAYLKGDAAAREWLKSDTGLKQLLGAQAKLEEK